MDNKIRVLRCFVVYNVLYIIRITVVYTSIAILFIYAIAR